MDVRNFVNDFAGKMNNNMATSLAGSIDKKEDNNFAYLLLLLWIFGWGYGNRGYYNYGYNNCGNNCCYTNNNGSYLTCYDPCVKNKHHRKHKNCNNYVASTPYYYGYNTTCCNNGCFGNYGGNLWWFVIILLLFSGFGFRNNRGNCNKIHEEKHEQKHEQKHEEKHDDCSKEEEEGYGCNGVMDFND